MYKLLEVADPIVDAYPYHANLQSILLLEERNTLPWICNYYVQLYGSTDFQKMRLDFYTHTIWKTCPWIYYQRIGREIIDAKWESIIEFLMESIDEGLYVYLDIDVSKIASYKSKFTTHDILIYGYDRQREIFIARDNFVDGKYSTSEVKFSEIHDGYYSYLEKGRRNFSLSGVEMICLRSSKSYLKQIEFQFNEVFFSELIKDYLYSIKSFKRFLLPGEHWFHDCEDDYVFGMKLYEVFIDYLNELHSNMAKVDFRTFHVLMNHKKVLKRTISFLEESNLLDKRLNLSEDFTNLEQKSIIIRNLFIKYVLTRTNPILENLKDRIHEIKEYEEILLNKLLSNLRCNN